MGSEEVQELEDRWFLGLRGSTVESVAVNEYNVMLTFGQGRSLTIEGRAELQRTGYSAVLFNEDETIDESGLLEPLTGCQVLSAVAFKTGALRLVLDTGTKLLVPFDAHYEAWQLTDLTGRMWVSLPGGGLAVLPPAPA